MFRSILMRECEDAGVKINSKQIETVDKFRRLLLDYNERVNLTRITSDADFALKHVVDSLMMFKYVEVPQGAKIIDVGTGPGIPGILLKIYRPDLHLTLLESVRKKTIFLDNVVGQLGLTKVEVVTDRAEIAGNDRIYRNTFDLAVARAVSKLAVVSELCIPFLKPQGVFVAFKGPDSSEEIAEAKRAVEILGGAIEAQWDYDLGKDNVRKLVLIKRHGSTPRRDPRRPGVPAKDPL